MEGGEGGGEGVGGGGGRDTEREKDRDRVFFNCEEVRISFRNFCRNTNSVPFLIIPCSLQNTLFCTLSLSLSVTAVRETPFKQRKAIRFARQINSSTQVIQHKSASNRDYPTQILIYRDHPTQILILQRSPNTNPHPTEITQHKSTSYRDHQHKSASNRDHPTQILILQRSPTQISI